MPCIKVVVSPKCQYCKDEVIKFGIRNSKQRYRCKTCRKVQLSDYKNQAWLPSVNPNIAALVKEGCGIRSIARLLHISATTVISRIIKIAEGIKKPAIKTGRVYEVDELKTYVKKKANDYWVICALDRETRQVVDFKVGKRTKKNLKTVTDTLLMAECKQIYTDGLDIYRFIIPEKLHRVTRYGTNHGDKYLPDAERLRSLARARDDKRG